MLANSADLAELLAQPEGQRLAFVRRAFRVDELAETLAALANAHGGAIIVGVSGRGKKIEGVADVELARLAALDAALACTPPLVLPLPAAAPYGDTALLLLEVPAGLPHVYSVHGKYLRRAGAANQPIPPDALRKLLIERGETSWERLAPAGATLDDLDPNKLSAYVQRSGPAAAGDPLAFLFRRGCLARGDEGRRTGDQEIVQPPLNSVHSSWSIVPPTPACCCLAAMSSGSSRSARSRWCATVAARWAMSFCAKISATRWSRRCGGPRSGSPSICAAAAA